MNKKGWKTAEKMFCPAFGCAQQPKAGRNTQQSSHFNVTEGGGGAYFFVKFEWRNLWMPPYPKLNFVLSLKLTIIFQVKSMKGINFFSK